MKAAEGRGHLQGREWGGGGSRRETPGPVTWSPGGAPLPVSGPLVPLGAPGGPTSVFGLQSLRAGPFGVRGLGSGGGERAGYGASFPCAVGWGFPAGGTRDSRPPQVPSPGPVSPNCHPHIQSAIQWGCRDGAGASGVPIIRLCPRRRGTPAPVGDFPPCRAGGGQVSTGGLVRLTRLALQAWPGTSCAGHWPGFSSGVPPA